MYVHFFVSLPNYESLILFTHTILHISKWTPWDGSSLFKLHYRYLRLYWESHEAYSKHARDEAKGPLFEAKF